MKGSRILPLLCLTITLTVKRTASIYPTALSRCGDVDLLDNPVGCCMCENNRTDWYANNIGSALLNGPQSPELVIGSYINNYAKWAQSCSWADEVLGCIQDKIPGCTDADAGGSLIRYLDIFASQFFIDFLYCTSCTSNQSLLFDSSWTFLVNIYSRFCNKDQLKPEIETIMSDPSVDVSCVGTGMLRDALRCYSSFDVDTIAISESEVPDTFLQPLQSLSTDILNCMFSVINRSTCNAATKRVLHKSARLQIPPYIDDGTLNVDESTAEDFRSYLRCTVGVYGDPHLKTCWDPPVACSAPGKQTYFSNKFLLIKGTNVEIGTITTPRATSIRSISITFSSLNGDTELGTYTVTNGDIPSTFDGGVDTEIGSGNDQVEIESGPFRFVQKGTGSVLILRQWAGNYFFTLRMAENVMVGSSGLLIEGCPANQVVTRNTFLPIRRKRATGSVGDCEIACTNVTDVGFKEACVIDCLATGDPDFSNNMAILAEEDDSLVLTYDSALVNYYYEEKHNGKNGAHSVHSAGFSLFVSGVILNYFLRG